MDSVNFQHTNFYKAESLSRLRNNTVTQPDLNVDEGAAKPSFKSEKYPSPALNVRTTLTSKTEQKKYKELSELLDGGYRQKLQFALKSGILLKNDSSDNSSVLDNLHKIATEKRDPGLDGVVLLRECLDIIDNPYVITQTCEDIPAQYKKDVIGIMTNLSEDNNEINDAASYLDNMHTGTCPTASIEFDLATKQPAEFFRMVEGLTSEDNKTYKIVDLDALSNKSLEAIWLLNTFKTPYQMADKKRAVVELAPDKNAIIRARIQNNYRDKGERSIIDVLMQSTMMQLGSLQTYDSITDKRAPNSWTQDDSGLIDFEKTYVESIMENKNTTSVTYQEVDKYGKLAGHTKSYDEIKNELLETLDKGHNIIIGYTWPDPTNDNRLAGHEITIVNYKKNNNGEVTFICQDSDDDIDKPIEMKESFLIPSIHHAGIPDEIASKNNTFEESWTVRLDDYDNYKKSINS